MGNPGPLKQALMNVMINAAQAIETKGFVKLSVIEKGDSVVIKILDSGCSIPVKHRKRLFEPFFTTKPVGEGSGLGLSVVHGIVKSHKGVIKHKHNSPKGTIFSISFPKN